ncbi:MAG: bacteriohopanetetrol glucosamine biosynthesis glycosyltransferase HpnI [Terriglobia bacterium]
MTLFQIIQNALLITALLGMGYYLFSFVAAGIFFSQKAVPLEKSHPPVSLMIPLCGEDAPAYENFSSLCRQDYPEFQIVFGVRDLEDPVVPVIRNLQKNFAHRDIQLVISLETIGTNLKVSNLENILGKTKYEHLVIMDSDVRVESDFLRRVISPLASPKIGLVTCPYRSAFAPNMASRLEALGISAEFMPGVFVSRLVEGIRYALGATMATTRTRLQSVGGFQSIANHLADDYMLGQRIARAGYEIYLAPCVVETIQPAKSLAAMLTHQIRLARGIRACRPWGHLGLIFTYGTVLAFFHSLLRCFDFPSLVFLGGSVLLRLIVGLAIGGYGLRDRIVQSYFWLLPARDCMGFVVWLISLFGRRVEWRGRIYKLCDGGTMVALEKGG